MVHNTKSRSLGMRDMVTSGIKGRGWSRDLAAYFQKVVRSGRGAGKASIVSQWIKPLPLTPASHMGDGSRPCCSTSDPHSRLMHQSKQRNMVQVLASLPHVWMELRPLASGETVDGISLSLSLSVTVRHSNK